MLGSRNCYYDPPSILKYPCIKYEKSKPLIRYSDNIDYNTLQSWVITIIDPNSDSDVPKRLKEHFKRYCVFDREYPADNLRHFVYTLYY